MSMAVSAPRWSCKVYNRLLSPASKLKPPLALELESRLLRPVLHRIFTMGTGSDTPHFRPHSRPTRHQLQLQHCLFLLIFPNPSDFDYSDLTFGLYLNFGLAWTWLIFGLTTRLRPLA
ncbi:hypothetical protein KIL84_019052 [Mauremys mutica]|uniref:Uncharacterized protein n=1 Tax=Mauremys mutica TaxID=74926 RepID=A0A9D3XUF7_9SAUR|nr:hypothetical protein KIL84_019052 [Mauremys mutica]